MPKTINIVTLGCSKNRVDSEKLMKQLEASGYRLQYDAPGTGSDIVIVNSCGFISDAKEESIETILQYVRARQKGDIGSLFVMGCLSERYKEELKREIPEVDEYFGVNDINTILARLGSGFRQDLYSDRIISGPGHFAYLKVSEGCDRTCSFCAIPSIRGKYQSRSMESLVEEAALLASKGVRELILIAQDLSYFGLDNYRKQMLVPLVRELEALEGIEWIRLHYLYPANFPMEILELMKSSKKLCRYIDLPIQHISDNVLRNMRRQHDGPSTRALLERIRAEVPTAAVRTTLIAGHPGETEREFEELCSYIGEYRFERLGVFTYSHEEDTFGHRNYSDDVPEAVKQKRMEKLMQLQMEISEGQNRKAVGKIMKVIIDRRDKLFYYGRTEFDSPEVDQEVLIPANRMELIPGQFIDARITGSMEFDLMAEKV